MLGSIRRVWRLFLKEVIIALGTPKTRNILIVPQIIQLVMFSFAVSLDVTNVRLGVVNLDSGRRVVDIPSSFGTKPVFKEVRYYQSYEELKEAIEQREIFAGLAVPNDFSARMLSKDETAKVQFLVDGRRANASAILGGYVAQITQTYGVQAAFQNANGEPMTSGPVVRRWFNPNLIARNSFMPGLICLITTTVGIMVSALSISREREWARLNSCLLPRLAD